MRVFCISICILFSISVFAQDKKYSFRYGFETPPYVVKDTTPKKFKYPKGFVTGNIGYRTGELIYLNDKTLQYQKTLFNSLVTHVKFNIYKDLQLSTSIFYNFNNVNLPYYIANMFYSFKWSNWRPHTFSFGYDNYAPNRFKNQIYSWGQDFLLGGYFVSYNIPLYKKVLEKIRIDKTTNFMFIPKSAYYINYVNNDGLILKTKVVLSFSANYTILKRLFIMGGVNYYPIKNTQMAWDPDYIYSFGYSDYRPWKLSVTYGNWIANRFDSKKVAYPGYGFWEGNFSVLFNYSF